MCHLHTTLVLATLSVLYCCCLVDATEEHHKRAPSGFYGVRGKKSISDEEFGETNQNSVAKETDPPAQTSSPPPPLDFLVMEKRSPYTSGFVGMRGKKPWDYPDEVYKRAPMGFFGMRGKKSGDLDEDYFDYPKRAPMGFFGMRGKKYVLEPYYHEDKRAPNGFFGVRGKKDYEDLFYDEDKRAPQSGFFGVRGKRMGFFGVRGKKIPYEFRGKFVGVRGKKSSEPTLISSESNQDYPSDSSLTSKIKNDLEWNQLMLLLTEQDGADSRLPKNFKNP